MPDRPRRRAAGKRLGLLVGAMAMGCAGPDGGPAVMVPEAFFTYGDAEAEPAAFMAVLEVEDRRASHPGDRERLQTSLASPHAGIRQAAVRALGRLERPEMVDLLFPSLSDPDPRVQVEGANALAQAVRIGSPEEAAGVRDALSMALQTGDGRVVGAAARSAGRLPLHRDEDLALGEAFLLDALEAPSGADGAAMLGVARGSLFLYRGAAARGGSAASPELTRRLETMSRQAPDARVRLAAVQARRAAGPVSLELAGHWLEDPDAELRREGAGALPASDPERVGDRLQVAMSDPVDRVRVEAVRTFARLRRSGEGCEPLVRASYDASDHVALVALDALAGSAPAGPCPGGENLAQTVQEHVRALPPAGDEDWHRATRALATLAHLDPDAARSHLDDFLDHPHSFVRAHAAGVAGLLGERVLLSLAEDPAPNVREAALRGLAELPGGVPLRVLHAQLAHDDPMLLRTTALVLERQGLSRPREGPSREEVAEALLGTLDRVTSARSMTSRDARLLLLRRVGEWGTPASALRLEVYLRDFDPRIAEEAASILEAWTGAPAAPAPEPLPMVPLPTLDELRELESARVEVEMAGGGRFTLRLLPFEAPTSAARFARMAREGDFDGLTLHRVVPNFVIQGGSPGANEYAGHGAYTRDELGLPGHWRGTVGISTRGRDTGDGQIFVNLVANLRLDHDYTVFALVEEGMEVVDGVQEGDRMVAVRYRPEP